MRLKYQLTIPIPIVARFKRGLLSPAIFPRSLALLAKCVSFSGQYFDAENGLHYNYYRDYDPATGMKKGVMFIFLPGKKVCGRQSLLRQIWPAPCRAHPQTGMSFITVVM